MSADAVVWVVVGLVVVCWLLTAVAVLLLVQLARLRLHVVTLEGRHDVLVGEVRSAFAARMKAGPAGPAGSETPPKAGRTVFGMQYPGVPE